MNIVLPIDSLLDFAFTASVALVSTWSFVTSKRAMRLARERAAIDLQGMEKTLRDLIAQADSAGRNLYLRLDAQRESWGQLVSEAGRRAEEVAELSSVIELSEQPVVKEEDELPNETWYQPLNIKSESESKSSSTKLQIPKRQAPRTKSRNSQASGVSPDIESYINRADAREDQIKLTGRKTKNPSADTPEDFSVNNRVTGQTAEHQTTSNSTLDFTLERPVMSGVREAQLVKEAIRSREKPVANERQGLTTQELRNSPLSGVLLKAAAGKR